MHGGASRKSAKPRTLVTMLQKDEKRVAVARHSVSAVENIKPGTEPRAPARMRKMT
jgi:hypothetical protein